MYIYIHSTYIIMEKHEVTMLYTFYKIVNKIVEINHLIIIYL